MDLEKQILNYLKYIYEEMKYKNQYRQRKKYIFDYIYKMMIQKNILGNLEEIKNIRNDLAEIKRKL